jgi:ABC-type multidrug transport system ATPase subunit
MIKVENISKNYDSVQALNQINFNVKKGELYGLIGPDGAGKTSLFRILTSLLIPTSGKATLAGFDTVKDYKSIRKIVGYMPERFSLYMDLTVQENLQFFATVFNTTIDKNYHLIKDIYKMLEPFKNRRAGDLSGGMKQKLALSCALIHKPEVLLLDEPTTGVDPVSRRDFWDMIKKLQKTGLTTLVSTPFMDDAELCDRVALIKDGTLLSIDTPAGIAANYPHKLWKVVSENNYRTLKVLESFNGKISAFSFGNSVHLATGNNTSEEVIINHLKKNKVNLVSINPIHASIEDVFMELTSGNKTKQ